MAFFPPGTRDDIGTVKDTLGLVGDIAGFFGGDGGARDRQQRAEAMAERQLQMQMDLAKNGVRWRVEDAKAAGIHPAAALGMQPANISPVALDFGPSGKSKADWLSQAGHSVSRSMVATQTKEERDHAALLGSLAIERASLENDLLRSRIAREQRDQVGPPMADPANPGTLLHGSGDVPRVVDKPMERITSAPLAPHHEAGAVNDFGFTRTPTGYAVVPSKDFKDRGEDQLIPEVTWAIRNHLLPTISPSRFGYPPPETWLPEGASYWKFDRLKQEWQPAYTARGQSRIRYPIK